MEPTIPTMRTFLLILGFVTVRASPEVDPTLLHSGHGQAHNLGGGIGDQGFNPGRNENSMGGQGFNPGKYVGGQGFNPGIHGNRVGGQGFNPGIHGNRVGGQGFNPGIHGNRVGGQGFNPGKHGNRVGGQGFNPGRDGTDIGGQGFNPGRDGTGIGGQGFNPGRDGTSIGGQGFNPGRDGTGIGGQGFNPGRDGTGIGGQGFNPGRAGRGDDEKFVAFTVVRAVQGSQMGRLRFERTVTDVGYGWDRVTNSLKVSYPGAYHFSWSALSPRDRELRLSLMRNGWEQVASWADKDGFNTAAGAALLVLEAGDTVYLDITGGAVYEPADSDRPYTSFTAFKIY